MLVRYNWVAASRSLTVELSLAQGLKADSYAVALLGSPAKSVPLEDGKSHTVVFNQVAPTDQLRISYRKKTQDGAFSGGDRPTSQLSICPR